MRKTLLFVLLLSLFPIAWGQKYACVRTDYIMQSLPDYSQALGKLNKYTEQWRQELANRQQQLDELRQQYEQESYLLPDNLRQRRQDEIHNLDAELRTLQRQRFAPGGDLDQKRAELLKPVQDRVYNAIDRIAREKNYAFVFDKSASATLLYVADKYDISDQVLELLGVKPGSNANSSIPDASSSRPSGASQGGVPRNSAPARDDRKH